MQDRDELQALCVRLLNGDRRALARLISRVEEDRETAETALRSLYPNGGKAYIGALTGPPGAGKSTLIWPLATELLRRGHHVAVLAIDPSSARTGGAVLGDRVRQPPGSMGVYFRSLGNRAQAGALAPAVRDVLALLDAAGFDIILLETVGAGQADVRVASIAHTVIVVQVPGLGDDIQNMKAGMLEIADIFVVNKADRAEANQTRSELEQLVQSVQTGDGWLPPVVKTIATKNEGVSELADRLLQHKGWLDTSGEGEARSRAHAQAALEEALAEEIEQLMNKSTCPTNAWTTALGDLQQRRCSPRQVARSLLRQTVARLDTP